MFTASAKLKKDLQQEDGMYEFTYNGNKGVTDKRWLEWKAETMTEVLNKVNPEQFTELHVTQESWFDSEGIERAGIPPKLRREEAIPLEGSKTNYLQIH